MSLQKSPKFSKSATSTAAGGFEKSTQQQSTRSPTPILQIAPVQEVSELESSPSRLVTSPASNSRFVLGIPDLDTSEDPFSEAFILTRSTSPSTFTVALNLHCKRGWDLINLKEQSSHIKRFSSSQLSQESPTSPTHKPKRARISMNHRQQRNMPSGNRSSLHRAPPASQLPQYITSEQLLGSTDSQESVMTQGPSDYHPGGVGDGSSFTVQDYNTGHGYGAVANSFSVPVPFATPVLTSDGTFRERTRVLNPASANFQPSGYGATSAANNLAGSASFNSSFHSNASSGNESMASSIYNASSQIDASRYTVTAPYGGASLATAAVDQYSTGVPFQNDYGIATGASGYGTGVNSNVNSQLPRVNQGYAAQTQAMGYKNTGTTGNAGNTVYSGNAGYTGNSGNSGYVGNVGNTAYASNVGNSSQNMGYGNIGDARYAGNVGNSSQNIGYGNIGNAGYASQSMGYEGYANAGNRGGYSGGNAGNSYQGMGFGAGRNNMSSGTGYQNRYNQYAVQQPQVYHNPANANRGKPVHLGNYGNNNYSTRNYRPSNPTTAPVLNAPSGPKFLRQQQLGGPVHAAPAIVSASPAQSRSSALSQVNTTVAPEIALVTPVGQARAEVQSESRSQATPTPVLRTVRGKDVSAESARIATTASWVEDVSNGGGGPGESQKFQGSPPKMGGLGIETDGLSSVKGADPFSAALGPNLQPNNPFEQIMQQFVQYKNSAVITNSQPGPSQELMLLTDNCTRKPTLLEAIDAEKLPFVEYCRLGSEDTWGVIKIKNIPYSVNRPEILAFLGRNARIISDTEHEPVHIVMERVTSKTLDAFVEFINFNEAVNAVNRFEHNRAGGRGGRLGQRHVDVELSSQEELMQQLFPKAKNVQWRGGLPVIAERNPNDTYNSGFQGFLSKEEMVMLVKHVEAPQRSPFSKDCPERPFECLISTLLKYPWYMVDYITIEDRNLLHDCTLKLIFLLRAMMDDGEAVSHLTPSLFKRVWRAALTCPGFSPSQKDDIVVMAGLDTQLSIEYGVPPFAAEWNYIFALGPKPGVPYDVVFYYAALIREASEEKKDELTLPDHPSKLFGELSIHVGLPANHEDFIHMTLGQVGAKELAGIQRVLAIALGPSLT